VRLSEHTSVHDDSGHQVGVDVRGWSSILDVALTIGGGSGGRNTEGGGSVADTVGEL